jgi:PTS system mannose-specific IIA component
MIGLVLVTHGRLAEELRSAMEHVVGAQRHVATVCIGPDDDMEGRRAEIHRRIDEVDTGDGVVLLTDMFGGTPSNLAISQMDRPSVEVIAGVNLPMLVKLAKVRCNQPLADAVDCAQTAGRKYIASASDVLPNCRAPHAGVNGSLAGAGLPVLSKVNGGKLNGTTG